MPLRKDLWRVGIARAPMRELLEPGALARTPVHWLPDEGSLRFLADPFGLWRDGRLYLFGEIYDYRDRVGAIDVLILDADFKVLDRRPALREPWHISYPFVVEEDGETYMLPEAHKSGRLTLYRAERFPDVWTPAATIALDQVAIDATPFRHEGRWWLLYTPATTREAKVANLHAAYADRLAGPWTPHPLNPVRIDNASSRPGGTPIIVDDAIVLPAQDCSATYGGALRPLRITVLTPERFEAQAGERLEAPPGFVPYVEGLHTLSAAGEVTLIDAKRRHISARTLALDAARQVRKAMRRRA